MAAPLTVLNGSVGFGGKNQRSDVQVVQSMLNTVPAARGGAAPALGTDGVCGSLTSNPIKRFQLTNQCPADGRIDAGGRTEKAIIAVLDGLGKLTALIGTGAAIPDVADDLMGADRRGHRS